MRLVIDTNRVIAALIKDSFSRKIILHIDAELITIPLLKEEVMKYKEMIAGFALGISIGYYFMQIDTEKMHIRLF